MDSLSQRAYDHIRAKLIEGTSLSPKASEPGLARELNISRTPVREAIRRLVNEGVLEQHPNKGTYLRQMDRRELDEIYELRLLIEPPVAAKAAKRINVRQIQQLRTICREILNVARAFRGDPLDSKAVELWQSQRRLDIQFHQRLIEIAGNGRIVKLLGDAQLLTLAMRFPETTSAEAMSLLVTSYREHTRILHAVKRGDARAARRLMHAHLAEGWAHVKRFLDRVERMRLSGKTEHLRLLPRPFSRQEMRNEK